MLSILSISLEFDPKYGVADIISSIIALLTLLTVGFSLIATISATRSAKFARESAKIAKESTNYTKKQTLLMEEDSEKNHLPKLIPISENFLIPKLVIQSTSNLSNSTYDNLLELNITNVFQGNAYMVSAWLEFNSSSLEKYDKLTSSEHYNGTHNEKYEFRIYNTHIMEKSVFNTLIKNQNDTIHEVLESSTFQINYPRISVLSQSGKYSIFIPDYISKIILHDLYRFEENISKNHQFYDKHMKLYIQYKTGSQLENQDYILRTYSLSLSKSLLSFDSSNEHLLKSEQNFLFSIDFHFINEEKIILK